MHVNAPTRAPFRRGTSAACAGALTLAAFVLLAGCAFSNIDLIQDHRVTIVSPSHDDEVVHLPVTLTWTERDLNPTTTTFAVFMDSTKIIKPGAPLSSVAKGDSSCLPDKGCPDTDYLHEHGIYVTSTPMVTIPTLIDERLSNKHITRDEHTATVVILTNGHRDGESAFMTTFIVARAGQP